MKRFFKCMWASFSDLFIGVNSSFGGFINMMLALLVSVTAFALCQSTAAHLFPTLEQKHVIGIGGLFFLIVVVVLLVADKMIEKYKAGVC